MLSYFYHKCVVREEYLLLPLNPAKTYRVPAVCIAFGCELPVTLPKLLGMTWLQFNQGYPPSFIFEIKYLTIMRSQ